MQEQQRYPLAWPIGWPRTEWQKRRASSFGMTTEVNGIKRRVAINMRTAIDRLMAELDRIGAADPILSTNVELRLDGLPMGNRADPGDVGVAVYFRHKGRPIVFACDKWSTVAENITAIAQHIDAIRRMDRYGVGRLEQALAGYQRMLSGRRAWFDVLGFKEPPTHWATIERAYKELVVAHHPDRGGDVARATEINEAFQQARQELGQ